MNLEQIKKRKGARKILDIPDEVLVLLNKGKIETVNLTEWLAIDQVELIENTFPEIGLGDSVKGLNEAIFQLKKPSTMSCIKTVGSTLYQQCVTKNNLREAIGNLSAHQSDTLRCYATYLISLDQKRSLKQKLDESISLIADKHFGVREIVWMALRPEINQHLDEAIELLTKWTTHKDENVRRFITEVTRPRGVWCKHIERLKVQPELALPILESLKSDNSKYVQDSVGNWLNDASKTQPEFVKKICTKWTKESPTKETAKIVKRALRTINKG